MLVDWFLDTYNVSTLLYDMSGRLVLDVDCDATSRSPYGHYLACWHPPSAPPPHPGAPALVLFDLDGVEEAGTLRVELPRELRGDIEVDGVFWGGGSVTVLLGASTPDPFRAVFVPLDF